MNKELDLYEFEAIAPRHAITLSFDVSPSEVELALATNAASLRTATLIALLAAMVVDDAAIASDTPN
jgi:hypothetical protein